MVRAPTAVVVVDHYRSRLARVAGRNNCASPMAIAPDSVACIRQHDDADPVIEVADEW